jgi:hypothetical protein
MKNLEGIEDVSEHRGGQDGRYDDPKRKRRKM